MRVIIYDKYIISSLIILYFSIMLLPTSIYGESPISILDQRIFQDLNGKWNLIGVVQNNENIPLEVKIAVNTIKPNNVSSVLTSGTFSNIIYPYTAAPFKFTISSNELFKGFAYPIDIKKIAKPFFLELRQNYSNFATGDAKALMGTIKNKGSNIIENVSVYASVHSINGTQIDSVKSNVIPIIYPNEEVSYSILPDSAIKNEVYFYSCAGLDVNAPISTLNIGNGEYLVYNLESASAISNFRYENSSDSIIFEIKPYNPNGGSTLFQVPQISSNQKIGIFLDDRQYENKIISMDGKTISMNIFIPKDKHEVKISGIRNQL